MKRNLMPPCRRETMKRNSMLTPAAVGVTISAMADPMRVALTFDDSLADQSLVAAPLVESHGWRAMFCLVTDLMGGDDTRMTWEQARELVRGMR